MHHLAKYHHMPWDHTVSHFTNVLPSVRKAFGWTWAFLPMGFQMEPSNHSLFPYFLFSISCAPNIYPVWWYESELPSTWKAQNLFAVCSEFLLLWWTSQIPGYQGLSSSGHLISGFLNLMCRKRHHLTNTVKKWMGEPFLAPKIAKKNIF